MLKFWLCWKDPDNGGRGQFVSFLFVLFFARDIKELIKQILFHCVTIGSTTFWHFSQFFSQLTITVWYSTVVSNPARPESNERLIEDQALLRSSLTPSPIPLP